MEMEKYASSATSSPECPALSLDSFPTPGQMALGTHLHEKPRGAVVGAEGGTLAVVAQKKDPPPCLVEFIPILKAPGVNPEFVKMSEQTLWRMQAEEDAMFEQRPIPNSEEMLEHVDSLTKHFPKIRSAASVHRGGRLRSLLSL